MDREEQNPAYPLEVLAETTDILLGFLEGEDEGKSHEAITILLMQGLNLLGAESSAMRQFFPVFERIKALIDTSDLAGAHRQAASFRAQLQEIIEIVRQGR